MTGAIRQIAATLRARSRAFGFLVAQVVFGMMVVTHAIGFDEVFNRQQTLAGADLDGSFCITSEDDDVALPPRDLAALQRLPGVRFAAWVSNAPIRSRRLGGTVAAGESQAMAWEVHGTSDAAAAFGFELIEGRVLTAADATAAGERPALITAALADSLFGRVDPIGRTFASRDTGVAFRVAGILRRASVVSPISLDSYNVIVQATSPVPARHAEYLVNVAPAARAAFPAAVEAALRASAPNRFLRVETLRQGVKRTYVARPGALIIFSVLVLLVLGVVLLGSLGMSAYLVAERLREIGVRRAMGATRRDIAGYFILENFTITLIGVLIGVPLSLAMNRWLVQRALPFLALDFHHLVLGMILFQVTALLAATVPALRASRVPPSVASRIG